MKQQTADDWFCPKCDSYVSSESVTYEETHQICGTGVIIKETKHMAQQTAVDFLLSKIIDTNASKNGDVLLKKLLLNSDIEQAKEIEKQQKIEFAKHCLDRALDLDIRTAFFNVEEYYNETYGKE